MVSLNPAQFRFVLDTAVRPSNAIRTVRGPDGVSRIEDVPGREDHRMRVFQGAGKSPLGSIAWHKETGEVTALGVRDNATRQGLATHLWDRASEYSAEHGLAMPRHSQDQLPDGQKWAAAEEARGIARPVQGQEPLFPRTGKNRVKEA